MSALSVDLVVVFSVTVFSIAASIEISTSPATIANGEEKVLSLKEGLENYTIVCNVTNGGAPKRSEWYIERPNINSSFAHIGISLNTSLVDHPADLVNQVVISDPAKFASQFLIKNFTRSFHLAKLQCGTLTVRRKFILRISVSPSVQNGSTAFTEGLNVSVTLNVSGSTTGLPIFPPINYTHWRYNGEEIMTSVKDGISVGDYCINFTHISRDRAGTYSLTVSNENENSVGYFTIEVYYPPVAILAAQINLNVIFIQANNYVTLAAFNSSSIDGWPTPDVLWIHPDGRHINTSTEKYNIDILGELTIIEVELSDNGTYSCILYNEITNVNESLIQKINLIIFVTRDDRSTSETVWHLFTSHHQEILAQSYVLTTPLMNVLAPINYTTPSSNVKSQKIVQITIVVTVIASAAIFGSILITAMFLIFLRKKAVAHSKEIITAYTINDAYAPVIHPAPICQAFHNESSSTADSKLSIMECNPAYEKISTF